MENAPKRNDVKYAREGGPYADLIRELVDSGRYGSAAEAHGELRFKKAKKAGKGGAE